MEKDIADNQVFEVREKIGRKRVDMLGDMNNVQEIGFRVDVANKQSQRKKCAGVTIGPASKDAKYVPALIRSSE